MSDRPGFRRQTQILALLGHWHDFRTSPLSDQALGDTQNLNSTYFVFLISPILWPQYIRNEVLNRAIELSYLVQIPGGKYRFPY